MFELLLISKTVTAQITQDKTIVDESGSVTFTVDTTGIPNEGLIYWEALGTVSTGDFIENTLSGSLVVSSNKAVLVRTVRADLLTEGVETFSIRVKETVLSSRVLAQSLPVQITDSSLTRKITIIPNKTTISEGESVTFTITFENYPTGTVLSYNLSGSVSTSDFTDAKLVDIVTVPASGVVTIIKTLSVDSLTESNEYFDFRIINSQTGGGAILATGARVTVTNVSSTGYDAFLAHLNSLGTSVNGATQIGSFSQSVNILASTTTATMWGSPHLTNYTTDSLANRVIRHALPDLATADDVINSGRMVRLTNAFAGQLSSYSSVNRNNYVSVSYGTFAGARCTDIIYWKNSVNGARRRNPYTNSAETVYSF